MIDIRAKLLYKNYTPAGVGIDRKKRSTTRYSVIHWAGDPVPRNENGAYIGDIATLQSYARWHVQHHGWDGLSYHYAIGRSGLEYQCRNWNTELYHAGHKTFNEEAFSVLVVTGDGDTITQEMYASLYRRLVAIGIDRRFWLGHQEAPRTTACPGAYLMRWLNSKRNEVRQQVANVRVLYNANIRDEPSVLSANVGSMLAGQTIVNGVWRLGKPVGGDSLWLEIAGDRYIHASALNTSSYVKVW